MISEIPGSCNLRDDLAYGSKVSGITRETLDDADVQVAIRHLFNQRGLILFDDIEPSQDMMIAISLILGPLKSHPFPDIFRSEIPVYDCDANMPGIVDMRNEPSEGAIADIDGKLLTGWIGWHFDRCFEDKITRGGVLRPISIPPSGGMTGFLDGISLYDSFPDKLKKELEGLNILYTTDMRLANMRFGRPLNSREIRVRPSHVTLSEHSKKRPRSIHPAIWKRPTGESVLHVGPLHSVGIEGREDSEGDALLGEICRMISTSTTAYYHSWKPDQMIVWDNWRFIHCVTGNDINYRRHMQRSTIEGDYGLGRFE